MALQQIIFPIDQPVMPEERQIGRRSSIDRLEAKLKSSSHQWLIGERRTGKTSVAKAVLARLRRDGHVALEVDLSRHGIESPQALAGDIARQAQAAGVGNSTTTKVRKLARRERSRTREVADSMKELGYADAGTALAAVSALLAGDGAGSLGVDKTLGALAVHAQATSRRAYLMIDEVHLLAKLEPAEAEIAGWCHEPDSPIVFLLAGSEESAARALREPGRLLAAIGEEFALSAIAWEDWLPGLRERFGEADIEISDGSLEAVLEASGGHPRRTMLVAARVCDSAATQPDRSASPTLIELAIEMASRDRSWR